jgi:hypothetical protein
MLHLVALALAAALAAREPSSAAVARRAPGSRARPLVATGDIAGSSRCSSAASLARATGAADAVVQKVCGSSPCCCSRPSARPASIRQRDRAVTVESKLPEPLAFPPEYILRDVQRTYFVPLGEPSRRLVAARLRRRVDREVWTGGRLAGAPSRAPATACRRRSSSPIRTE